MSDRRRRWICQFLFIVACVMPTVWVGLRLAYRPDATSVAKELQLYLGVPLSVQSIETPTPDRWILRDVQLHHPESGAWAKVDRWVLDRTWQGKTRWHLDLVSVERANLAEIIEQLHDAVVRQHLTTTPGWEDRLRKLPEIYIAQLEVSGLADPAVTETALAESGSPSVSTGTQDLPIRRLRDMVISWHAPASGPGGHKSVLDSVPSTDRGPRVEIAAMIQPPQPTSNAELRLPTGDSTIAADSNDLEGLSAGIPLLVQLERVRLEPTRPNDRRETSFATLWEVAVLERPLPLAWLPWPSLDSLTLGRGTPQFHGWIRGHQTAGDWRMETENAALSNIELADLELWLTGSAGVHYGLADIRAKKWSVRSDPLRGWRWDVADLEVMARDGATDGRWWQAADAAVRQNGPSPVMAWQPDSSAADLLRFRSLNLTCRWEHNQWTFASLQRDGEWQPFLVAPNQQPLVDWPAQASWCWGLPPSDQSGLDSSTGLASRAPRVLSSPAGTARPIPGTEPDPTQLHPTELDAPNSIRTIAHRATERPNPTLRSSQEIIFNFRNHSFRSHFIEGLPTTDRFYRALQTLDSVEPGLHSEEGMGSDRQRLRRWIEDISFESDQLSSGELMAPHRE